MDKIREFFKNIKIASLFTGAKRLKAGQVILGIAVLLLIAAGFVAARGILRCWTITKLPGLPPSSCGLTSNAGIGTPVVNSQGTPVALPPTPEVAAPDVKLPTWD